MSYILLRSLWVCDRHKSAKNEKQQIEKTEGGENFSAAEENPDNSRRRRRVVCIFMLHTAKLYCASGV